MLAKTGKKTLMCDLLNFVPGACSPVTLAHLHRPVLTLSGLPSHLASWNLDKTSPQFRPPSFQGKAFFRHVLAKLSPNFREKSDYNSTDGLYRFTKGPGPADIMRRTEYIYLHCKIRHVYMNFRQNFSHKKYFRHFRKTLAETVHYIPKGLRKGNPFQGPFAQLSYIYIYQVLQSDLVWTHK